MTKVKGRIALRLRGEDNSEVVTRVIVLDLGVGLQQAFGVDNLELVAGRVAAFVGNGGKLEIASIGDGARPGGRGVLVAVGVLYIALANLRNF